MSYNGKILFENYYTLDKVKELISNGSASEISKNIDKCVFYKDLNSEKTSIYEIKNLKEIDEYLEEYTYIFENEQ